MCTSLHRYKQHKTRYCTWKRKKRGKENHDILFEKIYSKVLVRNDVKPNLCSHYTASTRESTAHLCTLFVDLSKEEGLFQYPVSSHTFLYSDSNSYECRVDLRAEVISPSIRIMKRRYLEMSNLCVLYVALPVVQ